MLDQAWLQAGARFQHTVPSSASWGATQALEHSDNFYDTSVEHYASLPLRMISLSDVRFPLAEQASERSHSLSTSVCVQMLKQGLHYHAQPNIEESILKSANAARQEVPLHHTIFVVYSVANPVTAAKLMSAPAMHPASSSWQLKLCVAADEQSIMRFSASWASHNTACSCLAGLLGKCWTSSSSPI